MSKFKTEDKIQIVLRYIEGNESFGKIEEEVRVSKSIIRGWVRLYEQHGIEALQLGLCSLGCKGMIRRKQLTGDELDAINCALVAKEYASGSYLALGDPSEILMILPKPISRHVNRL